MGNTLVIASLDCMLTANILASLSMIEFNFTNYCRRNVYCCVAQCTLDDG